MADSDFLAPLSPAGEMRREAMLSTLKRAIVRRRRARAAGRLVAVVLLASLVTWLALERGSESPRPAQPEAKAVPPRPESPSEKRLAALEVEVIVNDPAIFERCAATDDELQALLAEAHRSSGIVRVGDRVYLADELTGY